MNIQLPEHRQQFVRSLVQGGQYASEAEVIDEALRLLEQRDRQSASEHQRIEALLLEGLDSGPATPMTGSDWDEVERAGKQIMAARHARDGR